MVEAPPDAVPEETTPTPEPQPAAVASTPAEDDTAAGSDEAFGDDEAAALVDDLLASADARETGEPEAPDGMPVDDASSPADDASSPADDASSPAGDAAADDDTPALVHSIVERDDGSALVDDRFVLRGDGSEGSPYELTWEMLISANETYRPRLGEEEIPERIQMLDGQHVKITGYLAVPFATGDVEEVLVMLNQWDGCCIGVPPSPYDSVEVRLGDAVKIPRGHFILYGSVEGVMKIDPYLVNNWLVGLYLMEDATVEMGM